MGGEFYYVGIPEQSSALRGYFPGYLNSREDELDAVSERLFSSLRAGGVPCVDMADTFTPDNARQYYSAVDHHFNFYGAYETYRKIVDAINASGEWQIAPLEEQDLVFETLPNDYYGSRNRKLYNLYPCEEHAVIAEPKVKVPLSRRDGDVELGDKIFFIPGEGEPSNYGVYMGGDNAETIITTDRPDLPKLLLFGDSFSNPVETLIYYHFDETRILDLRYYEEKTLYEYIEQYQPDIVISIRDDTSYVSLEGNGKYR